MQLYTVSMPFSLRLSCDLDKSRSLDDAMVDDAMVDDATVKPSKLDKQNRIVFGRPASLQLGGTVTKQAGKCAWRRRSTLVEVLYFVEPVLRKSGTSVAEMLLPAPPILDLSKRPLLQTLKCTSWRLLAPRD
jgi:hypothetical protein